MGNCLDNCLPEPVRPDDRRIDDKNTEHIRFFMTGLGSAGKTTIVRQLFLLSNKVNNYRVCNEDWEEERIKPDDNDVWVYTIRKNILDSMHIFMKQAKSDGLKLDDEEDLEFAIELEGIVEQLDEGAEDLDITPEFTAKLLKLFNSHAIQAVWKRRNTINVEGKKLPDGIDVFISTEKLKEVFGESYIATDKDKVHSRKPTVDMSTYRFKINNTRIEINDVGGQRSELRKIVDYLNQWSFAAGDPRSNFILLVVSMSDYNVKHAEYDGTLLDECVEYMKVLLNNKVAQNCGLFIFFNKRDRFKEKLEDPQCRNDICFLAPFLTSQQIADYKKSGKFKEKDMQKALADKFKVAIETFDDRARNTYSKYTCAVDSGMMESIFNAIREDFINIRLMDVLP